MVHEFICKQCGERFNLEAEVFEPGVSGDIYTSGGKHIRCIDPTAERSCPRCVSRWYEAFLAQLVEQEEGD